VKFVEQNRLEFIFVVLVAEKCWTATSAWFRNENHKNVFNFFSAKNIYGEI